MSFYEVIEKYREFDFNKYFESVRKGDVLRSIYERNKSEEDLLNLLSPRATEVLENMAQEGRELSLKYFGKTVLLYTPMYISNYCINKCSYCGYNVENKICRRKLNQEEIKKEGKFISEEGFKHILILTGESEYHTPVEYIEESIRTLGEMFPSITLEIYPMTEDGYKKAVLAGAEGLTVYQETYDEEVYDRVHIAGPKKDYKFRLDAPERGAKAGMRSLGIGALLGLSDFRVDAFFTALHGRYLRKKYPHIDISYALPRIRPCEGGLKELNAVSDRDLVQMILAYKLFDPQGGINISTREEKEFRRNLIPLGVTKISAGVSTEVGGHSLKEKGTSQFDISDESSVEDVKELIKSKGYQPIFKDWHRF
ncbi:2-iminoacetate synthase ThiH [Clostridium sp. B9]|uniref:2-iminoacetate synthase ThiH n=1 Tax=Clostridium sp. B9 TaxID=3423224 RepID=UPI003D2F4BD4